MRISIRPTAFVGALLMLSSVGLSGCEKQDDPKTIERGEAESTQPIEQDEARDEMEIPAPQEKLSKPEDTESADSKAEDKPEEDKPPKDPD